MESNYTLIHTISPNHSQIDVIAHKKPTDFYKSVGELIKC